MADKYMKKCSASLAIWKCTFKPHGDTIIYLLEWLILKY
jgi:hypothetical protein